MEDLVRQQSLDTIKITKQLRGKRNDTVLHSAVRERDVETVLEVINGSGDDELKEVLCAQNQSGETALYVAAECGFVDLVKEMVKYYDVASAGIKAKNGYDAFHIAAKQGDLEVLKVLMDAFPQLSVTFDQSNTTALHSAAAQGHIEVVNFLLNKNSSLATIARNNGKTALHTSARNGHPEVVKALLSKEKGIASWSDKKGQTALHMAVKGQSLEVVDELIALDDLLAPIIDGKGNTALHIATRKGRTQIVALLLKYKRDRTQAVNKHGETAFDIAQKFGHSEIAVMLEKHGVKTAKSIKLLPQTSSTTRELKQTVSDIKHEVHNQLEHTRETRREVHQVHNIAKRLNKSQAEGLNNAINSTTVVAVLIATVTYAAIFSLPGQYIDDPKNVPRGFSLGEARIAPKPEFILFLLFDSLALFISLAVVVVQTSVVAVDRKRKKQMMAIINKLMWMACAFVSVAFLSLCYVVVGNEERWLAVGVTVIGTSVMATTLGIMCYWVIMHRIEGSNLRSIRRSSRISKSRSWSMSPMSDPEVLDHEYKNFYAL